MTTFLAVTVIFLLGRLTARSRTLRVPTRVIVTQAALVWTAQTAALYLFTSFGGAGVATSAAFAFGLASAYIAEDYRRTRPRLRNLIRIAGLFLGITAIAAIIQFGTPVRLCPYVRAAATRVSGATVFAGHPALPPLQTVLAHVVGVLLCLRESSAIVALTLAQMGISPPAGTKSLHSPVVGAVERTIVFIFSCFYQFNAVAFVLTAKSVARLHDTTDRRTAEYVLMGTLLSTLMAILIALLATWAGLTH